MTFKSRDLINNQYLVHNQFAGGMGVVYIAVDDVSKQKLAIKTLKERLTHDKIALERFEREARCWINLGHHDNIVRAISFYRGKTPLLILEYIAGPTLRHLLKSEPRGMDLAQMADLAEQISRGLQFAHTCPMPNGSIGVIHRDIKPANILLSSRGVAKLSDFGLVRSQNDTFLNTGVLGTHVYMSPEQEKDSHDVSEKTDIYSLGIVLYEMITGIRPHRGQAITDFRPETDKGLVELIESCLAHNAAERPTADQLFSELQTLRGRIESESTPCPQCAYRPRKQNLYCPVCRLDRQLATMGQWRCCCGKPNQQQYAFCLGCGKKRNETCDRCGKENPEGHRFCAWCGEPLAAAV